jgi:hypothetical protein
VNQANGTLSNCNGTGDVGFNHPTRMVFDSTGTRAYIGAFAGVNTSDPGFVWLCSVNKATGALFGCKDSGATGYIFPEAVALSPNGKFAYVSDTFGSGQILLCNVNQMDGTLSDCIDSGEAIVDHAEKILFNLTGTTAYIPDESSFKSIKMCSVDTITGLLFNCRDSGSTDFLNRSEQIVLQPAPPI